MTPRTPTIRCAIVAMLIVGCIGLTPVTVSNAAFVDTQQRDGTFAAATMFDGEPCAGDGLSFSAIDVEDISDEAPGNAATFEVTYVVSDPGGGDEFDHVEVTLFMKGSQRDSATSSELSDSLTVEKSGNAPHAYTIVVQLYNTAGDIVQEFETSDAKGGEQPPPAC